MKLVEFTEFLVKGLVKDADSVSVKQFDDDDFINIEILVSKDDISKVIGKDGETINAIRSLVQTSSYINNEKKVKINVDAY